MEKYNKRDLRMIKLDQDKNIKEVLQKFDLLEQERKEYLDFIYKNRGNNFRKKL